MRILILGAAVAIAACGDDAMPCEIGGSYLLRATEAEVLGAPCGDSEEAVSIGPDRTIDDFTGFTGCRGNVTVWVRTCDMEWNIECPGTDGSSFTRVGSATAETTDGDRIVGGEVYEIASPVPEDRCHARYDVVFERL
jgi:hypothetical protein